MKLTKTQFIWKEPGKKIVINYSDIAGIRFRSFLQKYAIVIKLNDNWNRVQFVVFATCRNTINKIYNSAIDLYELAK